MSVQISLSLNEQLINKQSINENLIINSLTEKSPNSTSPFIRSVLLSKLTFNLSKGHYCFVYELLRTKFENKQKLGFDINVNEIASNQELWLQFESNQINKRFLNGKNPLTLCCYISEDEWALTISRLLIDNGAQLSLRDGQNGCTPLHYACAMLKFDLIDLFLKNLNFSLDYSRDYNGNTPLVYLIVSYGLHINKLMSSNTNINKINSPSSSRIKSSRLSINEFILINNEDELKSKDEYTEVLNQKMLKIIKIYIDYLKKYNLTINTVNRFNFNLYDFYSALIMSNKSFETNEVFIIVYNSIIEEKDKNKKYETLLKSKDLMIDRLSRSSNAINETLSNGSLNSSRVSFETIVKKNLLLSPSEMKNYKNIKHSKKIDKSLINLFFSKKNKVPIEKKISSKNLEIVNDTIEISRIRSSQNTVKIQNLPINTSDKENIFNRTNKKSTWRERIYQLYDTLQVKQSESYRKGFKISFVKVSDNQHNQNNHNHHDLNSSHGKSNGLPHIGAKNDHTSTHYKRAHSIKSNSSGGRKQSIISMTSHK